MPDPEFTLLGDACWLDFVNTARGRTDPAPDLLPDPAAYHRWTKAEKLISDVDVIPFGEIRAFRQQLVALAEALAAGRQAPASAVAAINGILARETGHETLTRVGGTWQIRFAPDRPATALVAVARSAAATLAEPERQIRQCAGNACSLFFRDGSASQSRHWCSDTACGANGRVERRRGLLR